jgi:hypothetical protein
MITINEEELQQLTAECGVTIHKSISALSAYERDCIGSDTAQMPSCFTVQTGLMVQYMLTTEGVGQPDATLIH